MRLVEMSGYKVLSVAENIIRSEQPGIDIEAMVAERRTSSPIWNVTFRTVSGTIYNTIIDESGI